MKNLTQKEFDDQIQIQIDVVNKILAASGNSQASAQAAISALDILRSNLEKNFKSLSQSVITKIDLSASSIAIEAANLLQAKFSEADKRAQEAAARYESAAKSVGFKLFGLLTGVITTVLGIVWFVAAIYVPTQEEVEARRREISKMKVEAERLEKLGVSLEWTTCGDSPCVRLSKQKGWHGENGERYEIPYKAK